MLLGQYLQDATKKLQAAGIQTARLDVLVLLENVLKRDRANLLAHPEFAIKSSEISLLNTFIAQREQHIPLAYIRGKAEFYGRYFMVNTHVLVPRPESEAMIELLLKLDLPAGVRIADIGTGSGCLGITAALELPEATVTLLDIDKDVLGVAQNNARELNARVQVRRQDLLASYDEQLDVALANLPYVPDAYPINQAASHEPGLALFAGSDGLDLYRTFWEQVSNLSPKPIYVLTESLSEQHDVLAELAKKAGYHIVASQGLIQVFSPTE